MILNDLYKCDCLDGIKLLTTSIDLNKEIKSINIIESTDIQHWGKEGMLLLSSYFAFKDLTNSEIESFISQVKELNCAAILLKVNRLVEKIPSNIIGICNKYAIPLFKIESHSKYQEIISEILSKVLNSKETELSLYYKVNKLSTQMSIAMYSLEEIISKFYKILKKELILFEENNLKEYTTNIKIQNIDILQEIVVPTIEYMTFNYKRYKYINRQGKSISTLLKIDITCTENSKYILYIFEDNSELANTDIVIIENLIISLQMCMLREYARSPKNTINQNRILGQLLNNEYTGFIEIKKALESIGLNSNYICKVLSVKFEIKEITILSQKNTILYIRNKLQKIIYDKFDNIKIYNDNMNIYILFYWSKPGKGSTEIKELLHLLYEIRPNNLNEVKSLNYYGGISDLFNIELIGEARKQSDKVANFLYINNKSNKLESFDSLGVFKLFLYNPDYNLENFVPESIKDLYTNERELYETLKLYLYLNKNFTATAKELFLHSKTIKYRISKIISLTNLDLSDNLTIAILEISFNIISYIYENKYLSNLY